MQHKNCFACRLEGLNAPQWPFLRQVACNQLIFRKGLIYLRHKLYPFTVIPKLSFIAARHFAIGFPPRDVLLEHSCLTLLKSFCVTTGTIAGGAACLSAGRLRSRPWRRCGLSVDFPWHTTLRDTAKMTDIVTLIHVIVGTWMLPASRA